jgi:hypothetical protein
MASPILKASRLRGLDIEETYRTGPDVGRLLRAANHACSRLGWKIPMALRTGVLLQDAS